MKPIDSKEQELINLFNLKFGHFLGKIILHKVFIMEALECLKRIEKHQTIYIDPPYNTKSSNFEYEDDHADYEKWIKEH